MDMDGPPIFQVPVNPHDAAQASNCMKLITVMSHEHERRGFSQRVPDG